MKSKSHFLDNSDLRPYFTEHFNILIGESDRGAVLLGVSQIDSTLQLLFDKLIPSTTSKARKKEIFSFRGPFGSLSSKLDVALVCRILPNNLIEAVNKIRKIRNRLAHRMESFSLVDCKKELDEILSLVATNGNAGINSLSIELMMKIYIDQLRDLKHDGLPLFKNQDDILQNISDNGEALNHLKKQQPRWAYAIAIGIICGMILHYKERLCSALENSTTLLSYISKNERHQKSKKHKS